MPTVVVLPAPFGPSRPKISTLPNLQVDPPHRVDHGRPRIALAQTFDDEGRIHEGASMIRIGCLPSPES